MARAIEPPRPRGLAAAPVTVGGLLRRLPRNRGALVLLALIAALTSFSLAALPGFVQRMSDDGLRRTVADARPFQRHLSLTQVGGITRPVTAIGDIQALGTEAQRAMPPIVQGAIVGQTVAIDTPRWSLRGLPGTPAGGPQRFLQLRLQDDIAGRIRVVEGRLPAPRDPLSFAQVTGTQPQAPYSDRLLVYETAFSPATATQLGVRVGDRLLAVADPVYLRDSGLRAPPANYQVLVEVVGLFDTIAPTDDYWLDDTRLQRPGVFETADVTVIYATGLLAPEVFGTLTTQTSPEPWTYQWRYFVDPQRLAQAQLPEFEAGVRRLSLIYPPAMRVSTGLVALTERFTDQRLIAVSVLALAAAGVAATALAVLGVLGALLAERRRAGLALVRSRGAAPGHLAAAHAIEGLAYALPAALIGCAAALALLRTPPNAPAILAALATAVAATAIVVIATSPLAGQGLGAGAQRQTEARRAQAPRLVVEALILILTAAGLVLLRRRGLLETGQFVDPYLVAVPILLSLTAGIVALRLLPLLARAADRAARRGRGLIGLLAARRLARQSGAQLATLAILLAVALATFASIIQGSIDTALTEASWRQVGADYRADLPVAVAADAPPLLDLTGIAGIAATARGDLYPTARVTLASVRLGDVTLLTIEPDAYATVVAGTPLDRDLPTAALAPGGNAAPPGSRDNPLPAIISSRWVSSAVPKPGELLAIDFGGREVFFIVRAVRPDFPGLDATRPFVIAPFAGLRGVERPPVPPQTLVYVRGDASLAAPLATAVSAQIAPVAEGVAPLVLSRRAEEDRARSLPLVAAVATGFLWGGAVMAALALGAVVAASEQLARQRAHEQGYLQLLGLRGRGAGTLALLELLPPTLLAALGGGALGVAMIRLLGPALDLTAFTASGQPIALQPHWPLIALLVVAVVGVATSASLLVGKLGARTGAGELLREVNR